MLYENFQFEIKGRNQGTRLIDLNWMDKIIKTIRKGLNYVVRRNFSIDQLGHLLISLLTVIDFYTLYHTK